MHAVNESQLSIGHKDNIISAVSEDDLVNASTCRFLLQPEALEL